MVGMNPYKSNHFPGFDNCVEKQPTSSYQPAYSPEVMRVSRRKQAYSPRRLSNSQHLSRRSKIQAYCNRIVQCPENKCNCSPREQKTDFQACEKMRVHYERRLADTREDHREAVSKGQKRMNNLRLREQQANRTRYNMNLLESQVHDLQTRLEYQKKINQDMEVRLQTLTQELVRAKSAVEDLQATSAYSMNRQKEQCRIQLTDKAIECTNEMVEKDDALEDVKWQLKALENTVEDTQSNSDYYREAWDYCENQLKDFISRMP